MKSWKSRKKQKKSALKEATAIIWTQIWALYNTSQVRHFEWCVKVCVWCERWNDSLHHQTLHSFHAHRHESRETRQEHEPVIRFYLDDIFYQESTQKHCFQSDSVFWILKHKPDETGKKLRRDSRRVTGCVPVTSWLCVYGFVHFYSGLIIIIWLSLWVVFCLCYVCIF